MHAGRVAGACAAEGWILNGAEPRPSRVMRPRSRRQAGITGGAAKTQKTLPKLPPNAVKISAEDVPFCEVGPRRLRSWPAQSWGQLAGSTHV